MHNPTGLTNFHRLHTDLMIEGRVSQFRRTYNATGGVELYLLYTGVCALHDKTAKIKEKFIRRPESDPLSSGRVVVF